MIRVRFLLTGLALLAAAVCGPVWCASNWNVVNVCWRPDENPCARQQVWDGWIWSEGWPHGTQFWPKYFKPAGSIHVIVHNNSSKPASLAIEDIDGEKSEDIMTTPERTGRIVWRFTFPEEIKPGEWGKCVMRLRQNPSKDICVGLKAGEERIEITVPVKPSLVRFESVSFSPSIDRLFIYARALDGSVPKTGKIRLDLSQEVACKWWPGPEDSGLAFAEVPLKSPWELGSYHLVEVMLADGSSVAYPVRAWDSYYTIGLFGTTDPQHVRQAIERKFNAYVHPPETRLLDELGVNYLGWGRERVPGKQSGKVFHYVYDEPDAHDGAQSDTLPYMDRLGLLAQREVFARFREEIYPKDQRTPCMLLVNGTYKPLNFYVYGQCMDVYCSDPYVPLGGDQCEYVAKVMECARDASTPCPVIACLWATTEAPPPYKAAKDRAPTPEEEQLMVFYALGSGAKGILYFADGGEMGVSNIKPLWDEVGRINADIVALSPYLAIGCPAGPAIESDKFWYRSLMCGRDRLIVVVVNKSHYIGYNTQQGFAWHFPAKDVQVSVPVPGHFEKCRVEEVRDGKLVPARAEVSRGQLNLKLDVVDTGRAFVISTE